MKNGLAVSMSAPPRACNNVSTASESSPVGAHCGTILY